MDLVRFLSEAGVLLLGLLLAGFLELWNCHAAFGSVFSQVTIIILSSSDIM